MANTIGNNMEQLDPAATSLRDQWEGLASEVPFRGDDAEGSAENASAPAETEVENITVAETAETEAPTTKLNSLRDMFGDSGEARPAQLSETERRQHADREGVDNALRMLVSALHQENLHPDDERKINLSLDVMDEVSSELDDEENDLSAHDILEKLAQRYDKLAQKAPSRERKYKYITMASYAQKQVKQFGDWKAMDAKKSQPKSAAKKAFDDLSQIM